MKSEEDIIATRLWFKIKYGFSKKTAIVFLLLVMGTVFFHGFFRVVMSVFSFLCVLFMVFQYLQYNGKGWRQVHFRGMLFFSVVAGYQLGATEKEAREQQMQSICINLVKILCGFFEKTESFNRIVDRWLLKKRSTVLEILNEHGLKVFSDVIPDKLPMLIDRLAKMPMIAQDAIAGMIEEKYGAEEVARYLRACIKNQAY